MGRCEIFTIRLTRIQAERLARILQTESITANPPWCHDAERISNKVADALGWRKKPSRKGR